MKTNHHPAGRGRLGSQAAVLVVFLAGTLFLLAQSAAFVRTIEHASVAAGEENEARLVLDELERDLGVVQPGAQIRETFRVHNAGLQRLVINEDGCGSCAHSGRQPSLLVTPRGSAALEVTFQATHRAGQVQHVMRYTTNDPERPRFQLTLRATVAAKHGEAEVTQTNATPTAGHSKPSE